MALKTFLKDPLTGRIAKVSDERALMVTTYPSPPMAEQKVHIYRGYLVNSGGSKEMRQDANATVPHDFTVAADSDDDRYIAGLSFVIADATATLEKFGTITALTNGCRLFYNTQAEEVNIHEGLKSNFDFVRMCMGQPAFGDAAGAFRANNVVSTSEGYIPYLDLTKILPPYGIKLDAGSNQKITMRIQDNTAPIDGFDCIAYGFDRFE